MIDYDSQTAGRDPAGLAFFFSIKMSRAVTFLFRVQGRENSGAKPAETHHPPLETAETPVPPSLLEEDESRAQRWTGDSTSPASIPGDEVPDALGCLLLESLQLLFGT